MSSLRTRVLVSAALILTVFVLLTGFALDQAIRDTVITARVFLPDGRASACVAGVFRKQKR